VATLAEFSRVNHHPLDAEFQGSRNELLGGGQHLMGAVGIDEAASEVAAH
jgi:hypothetical protein